MSSPPPDAGTSSAAGSVAPAPCSGCVTVCARSPVVVASESVRGLVFFSVARALISSWVDCDAGGKISRLSMPSRVMEVYVMPIWATSPASQAPRFFPIRASIWASVTPSSCRNLATMVSMRSLRGTPSPFSRVLRHRSCAISVNHFGSTDEMHSRTARAPALLLLFVMSPRSFNSSRRPCFMRACGTMNVRVERVLVWTSQANAWISDSALRSSRCSSLTPYCTLPHSRASSRMRCTEGPVPRLGTW
ncbi:Uncharacterised protein [Mycobacteroides abscessus subsp. bolletii]|nr:Uncharacterised protein [Mycobacteroides abscessus subsp. bolletii]